MEQSQGFGGRPPGRRDGRVGVAFGRAPCGAQQLHSGRLGGRIVHVANDVVRFGELRAAGELEVETFLNRVARGESLSANRETREPGEWPHGWQYWVSSVLARLSFQEEFDVDQPSRLLSSPLSHSLRSPYFSSPTP